MEETKIEGTFPFLSLLFWSVRYIDNRFLKLKLALHHYNITYVFNKLLCNQE